MATINCEFNSETLGMRSFAEVILPQGKAGEAGARGANRRYPALYLLHGLSDTYTVWRDRTSIVRYAEEYELAIVMPDGHRSFYVNMDKGLRYYDYMADELRRVMGALFPISPRREDTFVAGLSMGGYGALRIGLGRPDAYSKVASLSGATDAAALFKMNPESEELARVFGGPDKLIGSDDDLFHLASKVAGHDPAKRAAKAGKAAKTGKAAKAEPEAAKGPDALPDIYLCCGKQDFLYDMNVRFRDHLKGLPYGLTYEEEDGQHEWGYWDLKIRAVLRWLMKGRGKGR